MSELSEFIQALLYFVGGLVDLAFKVLVIAAAGKYVGMW